METKICSLCLIEKPIDEFPAVKANGIHYRKSGTNCGTHENRCRPCKAAAAREWRSRNKGYNGTGEYKKLLPEDRLLMSAVSDRLMQAKQRIKKYNQPETDLDKQYLFDLFKNQEGKCALSGVTLKIEKGAIACLSLDKIVPSLGYIKGNVQWVAWAVNRAKGDMDEAVFIDMCRQIMEHQKVQRLS